MINHCPIPHNFLRMVRGIAKRLQLRFGGSPSKYVPIGIAERRQDFAFLLGLCF